MRMIRVLGAGILSLVVVNAHAGQTCKPVEGHFEAALIPPGPSCQSPVGICTEGRVWGGIQGDYHFVMAQAIPSAPTGVLSIFFFTGKSTIALKSGDRLLGTDTGSIDFELGGFASLITFGGGTGEMTGATGQIRLRGELSAQAGTTSGDYVGTLCTP
jgi:hypothetical protein